jgi:sucrose-6-phosphate hydrolase SacC (GH32 family)
VEFLIDRTSVEVFVNDGEISSTRYSLPKGTGLSVKAEGGPATIESLTVYPLNSAWGSASSSPAP